VLTLYGFLLATALQTSAPPQSLASQMKQLGVRSALVISSQSVDENPVWSPDGRSLAINVEERWVHIEPDTLKLEKGEWHGGQPIGIAASTAEPKPMDEKTVRDWEGRARSDPRRVETRGGTTVELRQQDVGTQFVVTPKGSKSEVLWTTGTENCHGLALSPDEKYVAFVCELNGVIVATP